MTKKEQRELILARAVADGYVVKDGKLEHRTVWQQYYGKIPRGWVVHHIDHVKYHNSIENLIALPSFVHDRIHRQMRKESRIMPRAELWPLYEQCLRDAHLPVKGDKLPLQQKKKRKSRPPKDNLTKGVVYNTPSKKAAKKKMKRMLDKMTASNKAFEGRKRLESCANA